jgi:hypothetical protein
VTVVSNGSLAGLRSANQPSPGRYISQRSV